MIELRGDGTLFARIFLWFGLLLSPLVAYAVWGALHDLRHPIGLGIAGFGLLVAGGAIGGALWHLRRPGDKLVIDKNAQTLAIWRFGQEQTKLPFDDLGVMKIRGRGRMNMMRHGVRLSAGPKASTTVIGLAAHPDVVLYVPDTRKDMVRFAITLRDIIGAQYLPEAAKPAS